MYLPSDLRVLRASARSSLHGYVCWIRRGCLLLNSETLASFACFARDLPGTEREQTRERASALVFDYSGPRAQGPQIAQVMPLPALLPPKRFTKRVLLSGLKQAPANSLSFSRFTANSNGSPKPPMPIKRLTSLIPGASGCPSPSPL